ncbi:MAG TPA: FGGY family carbohydrate kinase [Caulifigura sp.]|nr:FGGY family carbohydrate kinase [Caulifigura sp.]
MPRCLGLDLGSSSIKAAVLNLETGKVERVVSQPFPGPVAPRPGWFEIDVVDIANRARSLLAELISDAPDCTRLLTCGQMGGLALVDDRGRPHSPYISWRDQRSIGPHPAGGTFFDVFRSRLSDRDLDAVGRELRVGSTIVLLSWLVETNQRPADELYPVTLVDAVLANLCEAPPVTEPTQALGLLELASLTHSQPLFDAARVPNIRRSRIATVNDVVGECRIGPSTLRCHPAVGDQQAALVGVGLGDDELSVNCSTGSQVSRITRDIVAGDYQIRPYFGGRLINTIAQLPAGRSLNVLVDLLTELARAEGAELTRVWETIATRSAVEPPEELNVDLAFFSCPLGDHGAITSITTENLTVGAVFRGAFRNMADNYRLCAERVSNGRPWSRAVLSGGLTNKLCVLREIIAARLGSGVRESQESEETLQGLLTLASDSRAQ